jgi:glycosyltransferase involved in cell wall biosynthesis
MTTHNQPKVSIITPTYNHEKFIGACIESVIQQTYQNWEQIIIDDGSTDQTPEVIRNFADPRIRYVHQENRGIEALPHTYNRALGMCEGKLVAILEGDDAWPLEKLGTLVRAFDDEGVVLAYGAVADIATDGTWHGALSRSVRKRMRLPSSILLNDPPGVAALYMMKADGVDLVPASTAIIRREALGSIGGFQYSPGLIVTDFPTFLSLSLIGKFYYTPQVMGYRRRHLESTTFQNMDRIMTRAHEYVEQFLSKADFRISSAERNAIEKSWNLPRYSQEFTAGRLRLLNGEWAAARAHFVRALGPSLPHISLAASVGWCLSWLRCDLEGLLALSGAARLERAMRATPLPVSSGSEKRH